MSKIKFIFRRWKAYRKLKKLVYPKLETKESLLVDSKDVEMMFILTFLVDLVIHKDNVVLIIDNSFKPLLDNIKEIKDLPIYTVTTFKYAQLKGKQVFSTPLNEEAFDKLYAMSVLDDNNYYKILL